MNNFTFSIIPGNPPPNYRHRELYNAGYDFYKKTWERIFNRPNRPKQYDPMGYYRQSYIFQINDGKEVIAQMMATHYNLKNIVTPELPYFTNFVGAPLRYLEDNNCASLLSLEYVAVHRDYSERMLAGLNLYKVIVQLAITAAKTVDVDAFLGHPRRLTKSGDLVEEIGFKRIAENFHKYGVSVDVHIALGSDLVPYQDAQVAEAVDRLWMQRLDTIGFTTGALGGYFEQYFKDENQILQLGA